MYSIVSSIKLTNSLLSTSEVHEIEWLFQKGSFDCACHMGYIGDGMNCTDIDECDTITPCDINASCNNTIGSYVCYCDDGYDGDGMPGILPLLCLVL